MKKIIALSLLTISLLFFSVFTPVITFENDLYSSIKESDCYISQYLDELYNSAKHI